MIYDLHTHTTASDGILSAGDLVERAVENDVAVLSVTDHDTTRAYQDLGQLEGASPTIIPGIEISCTWARQTVHIVGLNFDLRSDAIVAAVATQQQARMQRAERIADKLSKVGVPDAMSHVQQMANSDNIGRPHFARHLVEIGKVKDTQQAFRRYLGNGKIGDVRQFWPTLGAAVNWIRDAGGIAVLAHPAHYRLTHTRLRLLASEFAEAGGKAIEVVSGRQQRNVTRNLTELATNFSFFASCGSDFHAPSLHGADVGRFAPLPEECKPVWDAW